MQPATASSSWNEKRYIPLIIGASIAVPAVVGLLMLMPKSGQPSGLPYGLLPAINAGLNSSVSLLLLLGLWAIRRRNIRLHKTSMLSAFVLSALFLLTYVAHHYLHGSVKYGGEGLLRGVYFFVLSTHILLAIAVLPLAMLAIFRGLQQRYDRHRRIARWAWPIWFYVAVTGVVVYVMISPYYPS